jgi:hypothetical protein
MTNMSNIILSCGSSAAQCIADYAERVSNTTSYNGKVYSNTPPRFVNDIEDGIDAFFLKYDQRSSSDHPDNHLIKKYLTALLLKNQKDYEERIGAFIDACLFEDKSLNGTGELNSFSDESCNVLRNRFIGNVIPHSNIVHRAEAAFNKVWDSRYRSNVNHALEQTIEQSNRIAKIVNSLTWREETLRLEQRNNNKYNVLMYELLAVFNIFTLILLFLHTETKSFSSFFSNITMTAEVSDKIEWILCAILIGITIHVIYTVWVSLKRNRRTLADFKSPHPQHHN